MAIAEAVPHRLKLPLRGDENGDVRINIMGCSGAGKSTLSKELARILDLPYISLDRMFWKPEWTETDDETFRKDVQEKLSQCPRGWVIDGNYSSRLDSLIERSATDIIWLDIPFWVYFPRLRWRTFGRLLGFAEPCSPGCHESLRLIFCSSDSILWWAITSHRRVRKRLMATYETDQAEGHNRWTRFTTRAGVHEWVRGLEKCMASR